MNTDHNTYVSIMEYYDEYTDGLYMDKVIFTVVEIPGVITPEGLVAYLDKYPKEAVMVNGHVLQYGIFSVQNVELYIHEYLER